MFKLLVTVTIIFAIASFMAMTGRGGGNFYVLVLVLFGFPMHEAALTSQFILFVSAAAASLIFKRGKNFSLGLAVLLGGLTSVSAFLGGSSAWLFTGSTLKIFFSLFLAGASLVMLIEKRPKTPQESEQKGIWKLRINDGFVRVNLWIVIPTAMTAGFFSGMVGVSGGSFLVPLMVVACGIPVRVAAGTSSAIVAATALSGFLGHLTSQPFDPETALPLAAGALLGGVLGGVIALEIRPVYLKTVFAATSLLAAGLMLINALLTS